MPPNHTDDIAVVFADLDTDGVGSRFNTDRLGGYLDELLRWNPRLGLVSKQDTPRIAAGLIRRSVRLWDFVTSHSDLDPSLRRCRVADIGTGGGFPGLVWAMLQPKLDIVLIERKTRKTAFLERVVRKTGATGVKIAAMDLGEAARTDRYQHAFELAVMMAVAPPERHADDIERLLAKGGLFCSIRREGDRSPPQRIGTSLVQCAADSTTTGRFVLFRQFEG
ncbi:MAG: class I SAM-dependent methyltransferase [Candidatus Latescibacterota bacterium]|nr:MAG: class I SAM-dependent methyltransferase [Candidatus Latescibacterota bacterium]